MEDRRNGIVVTAAAIVGAIAAVIAYFKGSHALFVGLLVLALVLIVLMVGVLLSYLFGGRRHRTKISPELPAAPASMVVEPPTPEPQPAFTSLWRSTTEGLEVPSATHAIRKNVYHPGFAKIGYTPEPARVVLATLMACGPIGDSPATTDLVDAFLALLSGPVVVKLTSMLTDVPGGMSWYSYGSNGRLTNNAILARSTSEEEVPIATAFLNLHDSTVTVQHFKDPRMAELGLIVYPEALGVPFKTRRLEQWHGWFVQALKLPAFFSSFLTDEIQVPTYDDPTTAMGVMLHASKDLTQMIDVSGCRPSPGMPPSGELPMYLIADRAGKQAPDVALDALRVLCDHGLHVLGYEKELDELRQSRRAQKQ